MPNLELVGANDTTEMLPASLTLRCLREQIFVLAKKHATEFRGSVQQSGILQFRRAIELCGQHVDITQQQTPGDGRRHMHIHVETDAHDRLPISRKRFRRGDSPASARSCSTCRRLR